MPNDTGPWDRRPPEGPPEPRGRGLLWTVLALGLAGMLLALARAFPGSLQSGEDWAYVVTRVGFVALLAAGLFRVGRAQLSQHLRNAAIWVAIFAVLALGVTYADELGGVGQRMRLAFSGGHPVEAEDHKLMIQQDEAGAFTVIARVNGQPVRFMVDTGATDTVLSPADARRIGVDLDSLRFVNEAETANGVGYGAPYAADSLQVGPIRFANFGMTINQAPMSISLLGRSFLSRLESFEVRGDTLTLRWKGEAG